MENQEREQDREQYAQLVYRDDEGGGTLLQRPVEAQSRGPGGESGQNQERQGMSGDAVIPFHVPVTRTIIQAMARTTIVRAVARLESTSLIPIFAKMDVNAANTADRIVYASHTIGRHRHV